MFWLIWVDGSDSAHRPQFAHPMIYTIWNRLTLCLTIWSGWCQQRIMIYQETRPLHQLRQGTQQLPASVTVPELNHSEPTELGRLHDGWTGRPVMQSNVELHQLPAKPMHHMFICYVCYIRLLYNNPEWVMETGKETAMEH